MENIYIDFNNQSKSKPRIILGIAFVLLGAVNLIFLISREDIRAFEIFNTIVFPVLGLFHIIDGLGGRVKDMFGKRFISINEKELVFKYSFRDKSFELGWNNIKSIRIKYAALEFTTKNDKIEKISISRLDYKQIKEIKKYIKSMSENLNIEEVDITS